MVFLYLLDLIKKTTVFPVLNDLVRGRASWVAFRNSSWHPSFLLFIRCLLSMYVVVSHIWDGSTYLAIKKVESITLYLLEFLLILTFSFIFQLLHYLFYYNWHYLLTSSFAYLHPLPTVPYIHLFTQSPTLSLPLSVQLISTCATMLNSA